MSDMNTMRLTTRIDADTRKKLEALARLEGRNESEIVREALRAHLSKKRESVFEALSRAGGIGAAKGLPADLSIDKKHFEGFGRSDRTSFAGHRSTRRSPRR
jgi:predicted transcriptional regulator